MTKQELYEEIKKSSKDLFILEDMKRLGFWNGNKPSLTDELLEKKMLLEKELNELSKKIKNPQNVLKDIHKKRMEKALKSREETKAKKEELLQKRKEERERRKREELGFIGHNYSKLLSIKDDLDLDKLRTQNLPEIRNSKELSEALGIDLKELRFLAYSSKVSKINHYIRFKIAKKMGGFRDISAPMPRLKKVQYWILENILYKIPPHHKAYGFVKGRNILLNASLHTKKAVVINFDLKDFFPTISFGRVQGVFKSFGYSSEVATVLAILTTEQESKKILLDGEEMFLNIGDRVTPQGSPASPMISNLVCRKLDSRLNGIAQILGFEYSRYADDLSFSSSSYKNIQKMLFWVDKIVNEEGFTIHPEKTKIMRKGTSQQVTGVVVNEKPTVPKKDLKRFRALLHQIENSGFDNKFWQGKRNNLAEVIWGYANFINMIEPNKGKKYIARVKKILAKYSEDGKEFKLDTNLKTKIANEVDNILNIFRKNK